MKCTWREATVDPEIAVLFGLSEQQSTKLVTAPVLSSFLYQGRYYVVVGTDGGAMIDVELVKLHG